MINFTFDFKLYNLCSRNSVIK